MDDSVRWTVKVSPGTDEAVRVVLDGRNAAMTLWRADPRLPGGEGHGAR